MFGDYETGSPEETRDLAARLGETLKGDETILLYGDFGAGKTTFVQGLVRGLGGDEKQVSSPSFVIAQQYHARVPVIHVDLYRLHDLKAIIEAGVLDYLEAPGVCVVEWADRLKPFHLPAIHVMFDITDPDRRRIRVQAEMALREI